MDILTVNYEYPPIGGGGGVASKQIAEGLADLGHNIDVVTSNGPGLRARERVEGVNIYRVHANRTNRSTANVSSLFSFPITGLTTVFRLCRAKEYDCIHSHFAVPTGPVGVIASKIFDIPHVLSIHGGDIYDPTKRFSPHNIRMIRWVVSVVLNNSDVVVAQSSDTKMRADNYYDTGKKQTKIIPLPYEPIQFKPTRPSELGLVPETTYLISVGRLVERKGYKFLLRALTYLDEIELLLIGDGPQEDSIQSFAESLEVDDRVHLLGYVSEEKKFQYLNVASLYVLSSLHEGFGIVVQEALQTGLPIVATDEGGQTDIIEDGVHGRLVPPRDSNALAEAIKSVLEEPEKYESNCKERIQRYRRTKICKEYEDIFRAVSQKNRE